jgi:hypothetical protein
VSPDEFAPRDYDESTDVTRDVERDDVTGEPIGLTEDEHPRHLGQARVRGDFTPDRDFPAFDDDDTPDFPERED